MTTSSFGELASTPCRTLSRLVVFVRPWETHFMRSLADALRELEPLRGLPVLYVTSWASTADELRAAAGDTAEVVDLTASAAAVDPQAPGHMATLVRVDHELAAVGATPLGVMLDNERFAPRRGDQRSGFLARHTAVIDALIGEGDLVISGAIDQLFYWLAAELAVARGGRFVGFLPTGRPRGHTMLMASAHTLWRRPAHRPPAAVSAGEQADAIESGVQPDYMARRSLKVSLRDKIARRVATVRELARGNYLERPFLLPARLNRRPLRWKLEQSLMAPVGVDDLPERFVYLPLHLQPEASTLVFSPMFHDQRVLIELLARALPIDVALVVKENPKMWGQRPVQFYRDVAATRAIWVDPLAPSEVLIERSQAVLTLTGTAAIEAALVGKTTAIFGAPPWHSVFDCVPKLSSGEALPRELRQLLSGDLDPSPDEVDRAFSEFVAACAPQSWLARPTGEGASYQVPWHPDFATAVCEAVTGSPSV